MVFSVLSGMRIDVGRDGRVHRVAVRDREHVAGIRHEAERGARPAASARHCAPEEPLQCRRTTVSFMAAMLGAAPRGRMRRRSRDTEGMPPGTRDRRPAG